MSISDNQLFISGNQKTQNRPEGRLFGLPTRKGERNYLSLFYSRSFKNSSTIISLPERIGDLFIYNL